MNSQRALKIHSREWLQLEFVTAPKAGKAVEKAGQRGHVGIINLLDKQFAHFL